MNNELMNKTNLSQEEKIKYKKEIEEKEKIIEQLKYEQFRAQREAARLRTRASNIDRYDRWKPSRELLIKLLEDDFSNITVRMLEILRMHGYVDADGNVNKELVTEKLND